MSKVLLTILCAAALLAQQPAELSFDVASVKPASPAGGGGRRGGGGGRGVDPGLFLARNRSLFDLIAMAYGLQNYQLAGGPEWISKDRFDIEAKPSEAATRPQMLLMLRTLLAQRFKLQMHQEKRPVAAYAMTVGKNGPKLGPQFHQTDEAALQAEIRSPNNKLGIFLGGTMAQFAVGLSMNMQQIHPDDAAGNAAPLPVIDQTALPGLYSIYLMPSGPNDDLAALVGEQLGLKLEVHKVPTTTYVIDSAVKLIEN